MTVEYDTGQDNTGSNYTTLKKHVADAVNLKIHLKLYLIIMSIAVNTTLVYLRTNACTVTGV